MSVSTDYYEDYWAKGIGNWTPREKDLSALEHRLFEKFIPKQGSVLDFGCGDGSHSGDYIAKTGRVYTGVDISDSGLALCKKRGLNAVRFTDDYKVPVEDDAFDAVVCFEVLEHIFDPSISVSEIQRVIKNGGSLIGSVPNTTFLGTRLLMLLGYFSPGGSPETSLKKPWIDPHIRFFSAHSLKAFLESCGLENVVIYGAPFNLLNFPKMYKATGVSESLLNGLSAPFAWLGGAKPSLFSHRLYFTATIKK